VPVAVCRHVQRPFKLQYGWICSQRKDVQQGPLPIGLLTPYRPEYVAEATRTTAVGRLATEERKRGCGSIEVATPVGWSEVEDSPVGGVRSSVPVNDTDAAVLSEVRQEW